MENEKIKKIANKIGLTYWKALLWGAKINPKAFVYAEAALSQEHGLYGWSDGIFHHGGWDELGSTGISPDHVVSMWRAAGCRNSKKFQIQVSTRILGKRGETASFLRHYSQGLKWLRKWRSDLEYMPRKTVASVGRVSVEARYALLEGIAINDDGKKIRVQDLNWTRLRAIQGLREDGGRRSLLIRAALLPADVAERELPLPHQFFLADHPVAKEDVRDFCPAYPRLEIRVAGEIAMGTSPVAISNHLLSRKEAHQWLLTGGPRSLKSEAVRESVIDFLIRDLDLGDFVPRNVDVARWLLHVHARGAWSALLKIHRFPDGRTVRYLDIIDEIAQEDLDRGVSTGVERAFERSKERIARLHAEDHRVLCSNPFWFLPEWIRVLTTPAALAEEGAVMDHCVAGYVTQVEQGECLILSIVSCHGRSTVEVRSGSKGWWVAQHFSYRNGPPPSRHESLVEAWLNRENQALQNEVS